MRRDRSRVGTGACRCTSTWSSMSRSFDLVLIGGLHQAQRDRVREFCPQLGAPVYAEPLSGLREDEALRDLLILNERSLQGFTSVLRVGNVPTLRYWRDLDEKYGNIEITHVTDLPFAGLTRGEVLNELPAARTLHRA